MQGKKMSYTKEQIVFLHFVKDESTYNMCRIIGIPERKIIEIINQAVDDIEEERKFLMWKKIEHVDRHFIEKYLENKQKYYKNRRKGKTKEKTWEEKHPYYKKIYNFTSGEMNFSVQDVIDRFGETPRCYLTGRKIDISDERSFCFEHKIPRSRGGTNTFENMDIACTEVNICKMTLTDEEFVLLCKEVTNYNS